MSARSWPATPLALTVVASTLLLLASSAFPGTSTQTDPARITGPYASLLASSSDLGPSRAGDAQLTVTLPGPARPVRLLEWSDAHGLSVRWQPGQDWAIVEGAADDVSRAFDVPVRDYRGRKGQVFYASPQQPAIPAALGDGVNSLGRILGYTPHHMATPGMLPLDVPKQGLTPDALLTTYNAKPLADAGFTGKGATIVFFEFDGYEQSDLDAFSEMSGLPKFTPVLIGGQPGPSHGETVMDLEVAHAIAPDARMVVVNARPTVEGDGAYEKIAKMFADADRQFPGAVWSLSIGWGCDKLIRAADLVPVRAAMANAQKNGTTIFDASGDTGGLECKGGDDWSSPPGPDDVGLDAVASLPEVVSVGGTTLSTDADGKWLAEQAWVDGPLSQGTSGGVSNLYPRPDYQVGISIDRDSDRRLTPDVSAVADPFTGVRIVFDGHPRIGAGTSQSAPIWAAFAVLMNQYLQANGGKALGDLHPLLYRVAAGANLPGFRDVSLGANAVNVSVPGYDLLTGFGSPNVANLAKNLLDLQKGSTRR
ncbi:peptidase S53 [Mycolicibacterium sp. P9-64]|uniref:S53 family peptidase n=1 Tax=Mycolicibacterium sp. P9-64 TaxID=2024612 RepID=UPI0011EE850A|nr:S53 family peptidase [Mycolicibacterium sp. P9-64]KAA0086625.1 peptidase S53 [Mycolicibacterium sp. P9-64]